MIEKVFKEIYLIGMLNSFEIYYSELHRKIKPKRNDLKIILSEFESIGIISTHNNVKNKLIITLDKSFRELNKKLKAYYDEPEYELIKSAIEIKLVNQ